MRRGENDLSGIGDFLGYGNPAAKIWFVGGEEGFGGRMTDAEKVASLHARSRWAPIRDMYEAHKELREGGDFIDISKRRKGSIVVWLWMARFALAIKGASYEEAKRRARDYVFNHLGRSSGETFLTEASPFPCVRARSPHPLIAAYAALPNHHRTAQLRELQLKSNPVVICYGLGRSREFGSLFELTWQSLPGFAGKLFFDPERKAFLLPFFGQGQMSHEMAKRFCAAPEVTRVCTRS